jgi:exocyst complex component 2
MIFFQDTLRRIKKRYETDCREYGREPTVAVEEAVAAAKKEADQMFFDVLGRKDRADATRNALNVMNRFDCVFFGYFYPFKIAGSVFVLLYHQLFQA